ncbi:MAG: glycoside hydrolase family 5 protein [Alphaproteobacteria bacterium]
MTRSLFLWAVGAAAVLLVGLTPPSNADTARLPWLIGVNMAGAEFRAKVLPGRMGRDYTYPSELDLNYFLNKGFNTIRFPFRWERLQRTLGGPFDAEEAVQLDKVVRHVTGQGGYIILDPHNYARYNRQMIGSKEVPIAAFASFWAELAKRYKSDPRVIFGLMNEPFKIRAQDWRPAADAAIVAIRATGAQNLILVPGTAWSGAHSWLKPRHGISNAEAFKTLSDPGNNIAFDIHQYLDEDYSGTKEACRGEDTGVKALEGLTRWLRTNKHRAFLGEFAGGDNPVCLVALDRMLKYVKANADVWMGWTYWSAGAWWGNYKFSVHPSPKGPRPQMQLLLKHVNPS